MMDEKKFYIGASVSKLEKKFVEQAAQIKGCSVAEYIRHCILTAREDGQAPAEKREILTVSSAAKLLNTSQSTVRSLIHEGKLEYTKVHGYYRLYRDDVEHYIQINHVSVSDTSLDENYFTTREAADILGVTPNTVTRWIKEGKLAAYKPGRDYRISQKALKSAMRTHDKDDQ